MRFLLVLLPVSLLLSCAHPSARKLAAYQDPLIIKHNVEERVVAKNVANLDKMLPTSDMTINAGFFPDSSDERTIWYLLPGYYADWCRDTDGKSVYEKGTGKLIVHVCEFLEPSLDMAKEYLLKNYPGKTTVKPIPLRTLTYSMKMDSYFGSSECMQDQAVFAGASLSYTCEIIVRSKRSQEIIEGLGSHADPFALLFPFSVTYEMWGAIIKIVDESGQEVASLDYGTKSANRGYSLPMLSTPSRK